jgi:hypothetical protein
MDKLKGFVNEKTNTQEINAEAEAALSSLLSHSGAGGGGGMPPLTIKQELDERIELLRFLIDTFKIINIVKENSTILTTFEKKCTNLLKIESADKTEKYMTGVIKIIDEQIFLKEENTKTFQLFFNILFQNALIKTASNAELTARLHGLLSKKIKMYDRLKELQEIYRIGELMKGGKPRRTRRQKQRKTRRQKQRKSRRRL